MTSIGRTGIPPPGTPGTERPSTPIARPRTNAPSTSTGLQTRGASHAGAAPRNASLSVVPRAPTGVQQAGQGGAQAAQLGVLESRQSLGIDSHRLLPKEVMGKATSLENVAGLKVEILMMKEEASEAYMKTKAGCLARGDHAGAARASQAFKELSTELDRGFGYLKDSEHALLAKEKRPLATVAQSAPARLETLPDAVSMQDLSASVPWFKPSFSLSRTEKIRKQYDQLKLNVTAQTLPAFTDSQLAGPPTQLGSGAFNTVFSVELNKPDGSRFDGVFKPLNTKEEGLVAEATGISHDNPQTAIRNLATCDFAKALRFDVVADTKMAALRMPGQADPTVGMVMEKAQGKPALETDPNILLRPDVMRETTKLQLLDHLTGQGDRTPNNYFVHIDANGRANVTGIDNDQCFGKNLTDPNGIRFTGGDCVFRGTSMPQVVDSEMAAAIKNMTPDDVKTLLGGKLSDAEVNATVSRLDGMKQHIAGLELQGRVIDPGGWGADSTWALLSADNSYARRNAGLAKQHQRSQF